MSPDSVNPRKAVARLRWWAFLQNTYCGIGQRFAPYQATNLLQRARAADFDGSDIKVPWELSRLQFLPLLGKAYYLTQQPGYRAAARQFVDDWIDRNPVGQGANWIVAMEVALRALSVLFTLNLLWPLADEEEEWGHP